MEQERRRSGEQERSGQRRGKAVSDGASKPWLIKPDQSRLLLRFLSLVSHGTHTFLGISAGLRGVKIATTAQWKF